MAEFYDEQFDGSDDPGFMDDLRLAGTCELMAQNYSEDYRDSLEDWCKAEAGTADIGLQARSVVSFAASRLRDKDERGRFGAVIVTDYELTSRFECYELKGSDLPMALRKEVVRKKMCRAEELDDEKTLFTLGVELNFDITSEGECGTDYDVYVVGQNREISLKESIVRAAIASLREVKTVAPEAAEWDESLFDGIFTDDEAQLLESLSAELALNGNPYQPAVLFFKQLAQLRKKLRHDGPHAIATNLLNQLFMPDKAI